MQTRRDQGAETSGQGKNVLRMLDFKRFLQAFRLHKILHLYMFYNTNHRTTFRSRSGGMNPFYVST